MARRQKGFLTRSKSDVVITYNSCLVIVAVALAVGLVAWWLLK